MKNKIKTWTLRFSVTSLFLFGILIGIVLNPSLLYANKTIVDNYTIYHNSPIDNNLLTQLKNIRPLLEKSELYDSSLRLDICLNDDALYPRLMAKVRGPAFAWGFYNKIVLQGKAYYADNTLELNGHLWNFEQLLTHEAIHCFQYHKFGLWGSKPIAQHPNWKWEGYPEYVARQQQDQQHLYENIEKLLELEKEDKDAWAFKFSDGTISPLEYYKDWILVQYCLEIKQITYLELLDLPTEKEEIEAAMMKWFHEKKAKVPD